MFGGALESPGIPGMGWIGEGCVRNAVPSFQGEFYTCAYNIFSVEVYGSRLIKGSILINFQE